MTGIINVEPGTYYLALTYRKKGESSWYYMGCTSSYPNPVPIIIQAPILKADDHEPNNTQSTATPITWYINPGEYQFGQITATLHVDSDIDYYKMTFSDPNKYLVEIILADTYNQLGVNYVDADAQFAYSVGGGSYSGYFRNKRTVTFNGPTTLYIRVRQFGMNGLGHYEVYGRIEETALESIDELKMDISSPTKILRNGQVLILRGEKVYTVTGQEVK